MYALDVILSISCTNRYRTCLQKINAHQYGPGMHCFISGMMRPSCQYWPSNTIKLSAFCVAFRQLVRTEAWQADILGRSIDERRAFGEGLRAQSRATNANKATNIMDTNPDAVTEAMNSHSAKVLVHGHTHRPGHHSTPERYVLGAWERCGWYVEQIDSAFSLKCFSLAARYESGTEDPAAQ